MTEDELIEAIRAIPNPVPPASPETIAEVERTIGHPLPPLLRRLYLEVANGGFGPRDGVLGVVGSEYEHHGEIADVLEMYAPEEWPGMLGLFDWGCGIWSLVDFRDPAGSMWIRDPHVGTAEYPDEPPLIPQNMTLAEWLAESVSGNLVKAFETSDLCDVAERRRLFDVLPGELKYIAPRRPDDDEIIGKLSALPGLAAPASLAAVAEAERELGFPLPPLLRRIYLEVANGEFGPGDGILGVPMEDTYPSYEIVMCDEMWTSDPETLFVPPGFVWLCYWGSAIWSLVDCRDPVGHMWTWDPLGPHPAADDVNRSALVPQGMTLAEWLAAWLEGAFPEDFRPSGLRALAGQG